MTSELRGSTKRTHWILKPHRTRGSMRHIQCTLTLTCPLYALSFTALQPAAHGGVQTHTHRHTPASVQSVKDALMKDDTEIIG